MKLFIDDERFPPNDGAEWYITRNFEETKMILETYGFPHFISFDHDLGENEPTGLDIVKWMIETDLNATDVDYFNSLFPFDFDFVVHSQNPVGKENIECLLNNYLERI